MIRCFQHFCLHKSPHRTLSKLLFNLLSVFSLENFCSHELSSSTLPRKSERLKSIECMIPTSMSSLIKKVEVSKPFSSAPSYEQSAYEAQWKTVLKTGQVQAHLDDLNLFLRDNAFVTATSEPLAIDFELVKIILPILKQLSADLEDLQGFYSKYRHVIRWTNHLQKMLDIPQHEMLVVRLDIELAREVIEKKKEAVSCDADVAASVNKGKGFKQPKGKFNEATTAHPKQKNKAKKIAKNTAAANQPQQKADASANVAPSLIDFRVGFIQKAIKHPDADSLYVSSIDVGESDGLRTVCSGLVKYYPLEAMQERYVVVVCNLKPVNMRGIKSTAMILCGSDDTNVEFVNPPADSKPGDRVFFEGFGDQEPAKQLNPKKKIWEQLQPHFSTNQACEVVFRDNDDKETPLRKLTNAKGQTFKVNSISNATVR